MNTGVVRFIITSTGIQTKLRDEVQILGKVQLGFGTMKIGVNCLCYRSAMAMHLLGVSPLMIMIIRKMEK